MKLLYFATNQKEEIETEFNFDLLNNSILFKNNLFDLKIYLKKYKYSEFIKFLNKENKRIILNCNLIKGSKIYSGDRKIIWKNENIALSLGGIRIELEKEIQEILYEKIKKIYEIN